VDTLAVVMTALLVGILIVAVSSAGFGVALFWQRPSPQAATPAGADPLTTRRRAVSPPRWARRVPPSLLGPELGAAEPDAGTLDEPVAEQPLFPPVVPDAPPSRTSRRSPGRSAETSMTQRSRPVPPDREPHATRPHIAARRPVRSEPKKPIRTSLLVRLRAAAILFVVVVLIAALIGAVLSAIAIVVGLLLG
jgi:hypothetical protein